LWNVRRGNLKPTVPSGHYSSRAHRTIDQHELTVARIFCGKGLPRAMRAHHEHRWLGNKICDPRCGIRTLRNWQNSLPRADKHAQDVISGKLNVEMDNWRRNSKIFPALRGTVTVI
jgi:hypothetical protein